MAILHLAPSLLPILSLGLVGVGMASWLDGEDDVEAPVEEEGGEDDFDVDDDFGVDDFDDDFGGMDDVDGAEASTAELEGRIEELENEIANVSSTANTVRSENEQISEKVDEVQANVRKLLEIYEMVTRGVNPFVDDVDSGMGMGSGGGDGFGLFDDAGGEDESPDDAELDDDLADAEAEDFFDDDAFDEVDEEGDLDDEVGMDGFEDDMDMDGIEDSDMDSGDEDDGDVDGGTSFEELKEEYENGEADWADEEMDTDDLEKDVDEDDGAEEDEEIDGDDLFQEDDLLDGEEDMEEDEEVTDDNLDEEATETSETTSESETVEGFQFGQSVAEGEPTHLERPPEGYLADVVVLEWMNYLIAEFDARNAVRAVNYYQRIGWIGEEMRDYLLQMLMGLAESDHLYRDEFGSTDLTMDDHMKSMEYIEELASGRLDRQIADRLDIRTR